MGRDVLSRILYGGRVSLTVGFLATLVSLMIGTVIGGLAGFFGMKTATYASGRAAQAASESLNRGLRVAFRSGAVMGLVVVGLALIAGCGATSHPGVDTGAAPPTEFIDWDDLADGMPHSLLAALFRVLALRG